MHIFSSLSLLLPFPPSIPFSFLGPPYPVSFPFSTYSSTSSLQCSHNKHPLFHPPTLPLLYCPSPILPFYIPDILLSMVATSSSPRADFDGVSHQNRLSPGRNGKKERCAAAKSEFLAYFVEQSDCRRRRNPHAPRNPQVGRVRLASGPVRFRSVFI